MIKLSSNRLLLLTMFGMGVIFIIDLLIPLGVATGVLYLLCFVPIRREPVERVSAFAAIVSFLIVMKLAIFYKDQTNWMAVVNQAISIVAVWVAALLAWQHRRLLEQSDHDRDEYTQKLESTNQRLVSIQQALDSHLLVSITDIKGNIVYVNENFCNVSGYPEAELMGQNHRILKSGHHSEDFFKNLWNTISWGESWSGEIKNRTKSGRFFWSNTVIIPYKNESGKITQYLAVRIPITDKKLMEERQQEYVTSLEKILDDISHKLKSPIATCLGLTQLMEYRENNVPDLVNMAIDHRKTCAHDLINFSSEIAQYIYTKTKSKETENQ